MGRGESLCRIISSITPSFFFFLCRGTMDDQSCQFSEQSCYKLSYYYSYYFQLNSEKNFR